jgi:dienelactone hydrolase
LSILRYAMTVYTAMPSSLKTLGPVFAQRGWIFFAPYRQGQGLSASAGPHIVDEMDEAEKAGGPAARSATMVRLLETDHLNDQLAALARLKESALVKTNRVGVAGNSFGVIQTILGAERGEYCAAIDSAGAAQTWPSSAEIQALMIRSVRNAHAPIFFFQAENDWDLSPSRTLAAVAESAENVYLDGHSFWLLRILSLGRRRIQVPERTLREVDSIRSSLPNKHSISKWEWSVDLFFDFSKIGEKRLVAHRQ